MVQSKKDILNYDEKSKFLKDNGWTDYYHFDDWVQDDWFEDPSVMVEHAGLSTDQAYEVCKKTRERLGI